MMKQRLILLSILLILAWPFGSLAGNEKLGMVLLHGKQDRAPFEVYSLARSLRDKGYLVSAPEMPWSRNRIYDATYEEAMLEIDKAVEKLRKDGAQKIIVGGLSLGANAALGYGARRDNLAGLIIMAPGHFPEAQKFREMSESDITKAKELVAAGKGDKGMNFNDSNMGKYFTSQANVKVYLSYFDPNGPAVVPANAAAIRSPIPILWIVGSKDPLTRPASYAFDKAPTHPKSQYLIVNAGHLDTPTVAAEQIILWIKSLEN